MRITRAPQQVRAQRTRSDLLAAARRVFAERGYDGATIDDVAERAGCSKGAYYFHFASKEEALLALLDDWARDRTARLREVSRDALLETLLVPETGGGWGPRLLVEFWEQAGRNKRVQHKMAAVERSWRKTLQDRLGAEGDGALAAQIALALHHGLVVQGCLGQVSRARARECAAALESLIAQPKALRRAG